MGRATVYVDIDYTIAGGFPFGRFYNAYWGLGLKDSVLDRITDEEFWDLPAVRARVLSLDPVELRWARYHASIDVESVGQRSPILGSRDVLRELALAHHVRYVSLRWALDRDTGNPIEGHQRALQAATVRWLERHDYPNAKEVTLVPSFARKMTIAGKDPADRVIIIDDRYKDLLQVVADVRKNHGDEHGFIQRVRRDITIIAYDTNAVDCETHGVRTIAAPSWSDFPLNIFDHVIL